jgi:hypothetical protein
MASIKLSIHIPHDNSAAPDTVLSLVEELSSTPDRVFETSKELQEYLMEVRGTPNRSELVATARNLGILTESEHGLQITELGLALRKIRDDTRKDLLHFLMYSGWSENSPQSFLPCWAYRHICDEYWKMGEVDLSNNFLDQQVGETINIAHATFSSLSVGEFDEIAFSRQSIHGAHNWLEAVNPQVIEGKTFKRRTFCPPELLMMAISHVLEAEDNVLGIDILLTPDKRERISKICLLEPDSLDRVLDWTMPIFSNLITPGTTAGFYGRFIRLSRRPTLADMVR